jgi:PAS domain-containing protein
MVVALTGPSPETEREGRMTTDASHAAGEAHGLGAALESLVESTGAAAGWVGWRDAGDRLVFPLARGEIHESWLRLQQGRAGPWGFEVGSGPVLLNDLPSLPEPAPPLRNLLCAPLGTERPAGAALVLANKPEAFTAQDAAVAGALARCMAKHLSLAGAETDALPATLWRRVLDRAGVGALVVDESGTLRYASAAWLGWSGFRAEDLVDRPAPFPFWVRAADLAAAGGPLPPDALPFRRRDGSALWCRMDLLAEDCGGRRLTAAILHPVLPSGPTTAKGEGIARTPAADWLALLLHPAGGIDFWNERWEERTGLASGEMQGSGSEMVLDWLFPRQDERERVADWLQQSPPRSGQFVLEVVTPAGRLPQVCTFLPTGGAAGRPPRWLLLLGAAPAEGPPPGEPAADVPETLRLDTSSTPHGPHPKSERPAPRPPRP